MAFCACLHMNALIVLSLEFPYLETGIIHTEIQQQSLAGTPLCTLTWVSFDTPGKHEGRLAWYSRCTSNPILKPGS